MHSRERLIDNWKKILASNAARIITIQKAVREPQVARKLTLVANCLQNNFKIAHLTVTKLERELESRGIADRYWIPLARDLGSYIGVFYVLSETSQQLLREFNWSFRRRITEAGVGGLTIEETGSRRLDLDDFGVFDGMVSAIVANSSFAYSRVSSIFANI